MTHRKALIAGVTGQDGSYLAEFLLQLGYQVVGLVRRSSSFNTSRIDHLLNKPGNNFQLIHFDIQDHLALCRILGELKPDEFYNLAAQSHVRVSFEIPMFTNSATGQSALAIAEAVRIMSPSTKVYQASSSEMFGSTPPPQSESSAFSPQSPYGTAKLMAYWTIRNYRESYGLFFCNGILFNHESPRRTPTFVTRKITRSAARISRGLDSQLALGNLSARRDWGYAPDYVIAMWKMLQLDEPSDLILGTQTSMSVRDWAEKAFGLVGLEVDQYLVHDERYLRPNEVDDLVADASRAREILDWDSNMHGDKLLEVMVAHDLGLIDDPNLVDEPKSETWVSHLREFHGFGGGAP